MRKKPLVMPLNQSKMALTSLVHLMVHAAVVLETLVNNSLILAPED